MYYRCVLYVVRLVSIAGQRVAKHIPAEANAPNGRTSIGRQWRRKQALSIVEVVFSMDPP
jgi:hypothetical protein